MGITDIRVITVINDITDIMVITDIRDYAESLIETFHIFDRDPDRSYKLLILLKDA